MFASLFFVICLSLTLLSTFVNADNITESQKKLVSADDFYNTFVKKEKKNKPKTGLSRGMNIGNGTNATGMSRGMNINMNKTRSYAKPIEIKETTTQAGENSCAAGNSSMGINIQFEPNSSRVRKEDLQQLKNLADGMNKSGLSDCFFLVEGHTDAEGNDYYNLWLSQQRANSVIQQLSQYNVKSKRLLALGKGESELLNILNPNAAENRRVQFKVINYAE